MLDAKRHGLAKLAGLRSPVREKAHELLEAALLEGIVLRLTHGLRTGPEQEAEWAKGRTVDGIPCHHGGERQPRALGTCEIHPRGKPVTNARAGESWHNFGLAFDVAIVSYQGDATPRDLYDGPWSRVGALGEAIGLAWGGRWPHGVDSPHFELRGGRTLAQARAEFGVPAPPAAGLA